jgi:SAM-dependent methyltransferase
MSPGSASVTSRDQALATQPFTDPAQVPALYADQIRVARRSGALLDAKIQGRHAGELIADLMETALGSPPTPPQTQRRTPEVIADIGCGTGHPTRTLARRFPAARLLAIDASTAMLTAARTHLQAQLAARAHRITYLRADFHRLPLADGVCGAALAAFCLYHSPRPHQPISEIARVLAPGGTAVLVTKSADSYQELDQLLTYTGLDPGATTRPSLYATAPGVLLPAQAASAFTVQTVINDRHVFRFRDARHLADYLTTVPKYHLADPLHANPPALAAELRRRRGDGPTLTTSTITFVVARRSP